MADDGSKIPSPFDVPTIRDLVSLMSEHKLTEIDLRMGEQRIRLMRGPRGHIGVPAAVPLVAPPAAAAAPPPSAPAQPVVTLGAPAAAPGRELRPIKSPVIGTFYASPEPNAEPFVRVGTRVNPSTVVCIIEAMKIFNEITADCSGVIKEICVENQQAVEFDTVLFRVDPNG
ncbi:MAG: acetyl-CoA carboxylase biotin carboxyl carrier protein [Gemmataceae bacterium]